MACDWRVDPFILSIVFLPHHHFLSPASRFRFSSLFFTFFISVCLYVLFAGTRVPLCAPEHLKTAQNPMVLTATTTATAKTTATAHRTLIVEAAEVLEMETDMVMA